MKVPALAPFPETKTGDGKLPSAEHAIAAYTADVAFSVPTPWTQRSMW